ncbi:MAG: hypothetical protein JSR17_10465 [Proteobacteria bacterium]|nr:hypothetical protein [Pseudomonadota bacterium]
MLNMRKEIIEHSKAAIACLKSGTQADLRLSEVLKEAINLLKTDPELAQLTHLKLKLDNSAGSESLEILSAFLINVQYQVSLQLVLNNPATIFQLPYLGKAVALNPFIQSVQIEGEIATDKTKQYWENIQLLLLRNQGLAREGFNETSTLQEIIHKRTEAKVRDPSIMDLNFDKTHATKIGM